MILSTQEITGDGTEQVIDLPEVDHEARIAIIFDGFDEDLTLRQSAGGPGLRIPASEPQPFPTGRYRRGTAPDRIVVSAGDSVDITIVRSY